MPFVPYFDRIEMGAMWSEAEQLQDEDTLAAGANRRELSSWGVSIKSRTIILLMVQK